MITFRVEGIPPSYNAAFKINYNFRQVYLSSEVRVFKNSVKMCVPPVDFTTANNYRLSIEYHSDFKYKNGKQRKIDLQNMDKILIDAIFEKIGIDDSYLWELQEMKVQDITDYTVVAIDAI